MPGENAPPDPPLLLTAGAVDESRAHFCSRKFWRMSGKICLAGGPLRSAVVSLMSSTCKHVTTDRRDTGDSSRGQNNKGCWASGVNSRRIRAAGL